MARYRVLKKIAKTQILVSLPHHSRKARGQTKQRTATIFATMSPVGCAFWGSDECRPLLLVFCFIFNQAASLLLYPTSPYRGIDFLYQHFLSAAYLDATELYQSCISEALQFRHYYGRDILARYLQLCDQDPVRDRFVIIPIK